MGTQQLQRQHMAMAVAACFTACLPVSSSSFLLVPGWRARTSVSNTRYTIDDAICPPTDEKVLRDLINRSCSSIDTFLEKKPIAAHTAAAFEAIKDFVDPQKEIVLDSGCGTGRSTVILGQMHPDRQIIGIDRSFIRLNRNAKLKNDNDLSMEESRRPFQSISSNTLLVRAELADFWRCCLDEGWHISHHYLLYPNPYPTKARTKRRWYGHPAFPLILQLGGEIMIRSNWQGFLDEFAKSVEYAAEYLSEAGVEHNYALPYRQDALAGPVERLDKAKAWTNFEKKYDDIGEPTYELVLRAALRNNDSSEKQTSSMSFRR